MFFSNISSPLAQRVPEAVQPKLGPDPAWQSQDQRKQEHAAKEPHSLNRVRAWLLNHLKPWENLLRHGKTERIAPRQIQAPHLGYSTYDSPKGPVTSVINLDAAALVQRIRSDVLSSNQRMSKQPGKSDSKKAPDKQAPVSVEYLPRALTRPITVDEICFNPHLEAQEKENRRILAQSKFWDTSNLIDPFHEMEVDEQE